jgi:hypothetical protein
VAEGHGNSPHFRTIRFHPDVHVAVRGNELGVVAFQHAAVRVSHDETLPSGRQDVGRLREWRLCSSARQQLDLVDHHDQVSGCFQERPVPGFKAFLARQLDDQPAGGVPVW